MWTVNNSCSAHVASCKVPHCFSLPFSRKSNQRICGVWLPRRRKICKGKVQACAEQRGSDSEPEKRKGMSGIRPEEFYEPNSVLEGVARLTAAETSRTLIEANSNATLLFSSLLDDDIPEEVLFHELPYATDEFGNIYFKVQDDDNIMPSLASESNTVQVIIGLDTKNMLNDIELVCPVEIDFGLDENEDEDNNVEDYDDEDENDSEYEDDNTEDSLAVHGEDDEDNYDETLEDWTKTKTMHSCHPVIFAQTMAEVASHDHVDWKEKPPVGLSIEGHLRLASLEEHSIIQEYRSYDQFIDDSVTVGAKENPLKSNDYNISNGSENRSEFKDGLTSAEDFNRDESERNTSSLYKLEPVTIQLLSALGPPTLVEVEDLKKAKPDAIAPLASKIISRLEASQVLTEQALKSLCWRCKGIQVEEAALIGIDSLGFDLRVCSGTQIQTLRFTFDTKVTSEYSAERQLNDLMSPVHHESTRE